MIRTCLIRHLHTEDGHHKDYEGHHRHKHRVGHRHHHRRHKHHKHHHQQERPASEHGANVDGGKGGGWVDGAVLPGKAGEGRPKKSTFRTLEKTSKKKHTIEYEEHPVCEAGHKDFADYGLGTRA